MQGTVAVWWKTKSEVAHHLHKYGKILVFIPNTERKAMFSYEIETVTRHSPEEPHMFAPCLFLSFYGRSARFWLERHLFMMCVPISTSYIWQHKRRRVPPVNTTCVIKVLLTFHMVCVSKKWWWGQRFPLGAWKQTRFNECDRPWTKYMTGSPLQNSCAFGLGSVWQNWEVTVMLVGMLQWLTARLIPCVRLPYGAVQCIANQ